jgi:hypothetical protein
MKEGTERIVRVGLQKDPKVIFDEVEQITAEMIRSGWSLSESCLEDSLGNIHLLFERELTGTGGLA